MSLTAFVILLLAASVCAAAARVVAEETHGGAIITIVLAALGAIVGAWIPRALELPDYLGVSIRGRVVSLLWTFIGAALFLAFLNVFTKRAT